MMALAARIGIVIGVIAAVVAIFWFDDWSRRPGRLNAAFRCIVVIPCIVVYWLAFAGATLGLLWIVGGFFYWLATGQIIVFREGSP